MSTSTSTMPFGTWVAAQDFVHSAVFYRDLQGYLAAAVPFVRGGLEHGEPVLVAVPSANVEVLRGVLGHTGDGLRFLDMAEAGRNPDRIIPWVLRAFVGQYRGRRVRIVSEPIWPGRAPEEIPIGVQQEALVNSEFAGSAATFLCPYDAARLDPGILGYAARTHPVIEDGQGRRESTAYTDPDLVVSNLNQPLPDPRGPVTELVFDATGLPALGVLTAEHARLAGLTPARVRDLRVAVNEIATDTIVHGTGPGRFRVWREPDRVLCEVRGPGGITDWLAGRVRPAASSTRGRGLLGANRLCDLVQVYIGPEGATTRLHMRT